MASETDRFKATVTLNIEKFQEDGSLAPFATTTQEYSGLDYVQLVEFQEVAFGALVPALLALGRQDAEKLTGKDKKEDKAKYK
jgi:hypothetical protein